MNSNRGTGLPATKTKHSENQALQELFQRWSHPPHTFPALNLRSPGSSLMLPQDRREPYFARDGAMKNSQQQSSIAELRMKARQHAETYMSNR